MGSTVESDSLLLKVAGREVARQQADITGDLLRPVVRLVVADLFHTAGKDPAVDPNLDLEVWRDSSGCSGLYGAEPVKQLVRGSGPEEVLAGYRLGRFEGLNNEPDMEAPWSYHYVGRPDRTAEIVHNIVHQQFGTGRGGRQLWAGSKPGHPLQQRHRLSPRCQWRAARQSWK